MNAKALPVIFCLVAVTAIPPPVQAIYVPEPEEILEAYVNGLIEYPDYITLLEISRGIRRTPADTLDYVQFPDLLIGLTANPYLIERDEPVPPDSGSWG